ncbi:MAG: response regulator transcription factor [Bifidobacteriaceae bacterium]|jgi:DNA-binding NarL/FixJ family response regulator|nr:response regulator transcription factor [Bifidobacteriaceae bacterium]
MTAVIRVLLVDDQPMMRLGFAMVLAAEEGIEVVGEAADGRAAVTQVAALSPDVILMDVRMPTVDGIEATRSIVEAHPAAKVILLTTFDRDEYAFAGLRAGASGFLLKDVRPAELVAAIRAVQAGDAAVSPRVTRRMLEMFAARLPVEGGVGGGPDTSGGEAPGDGPKLSAAENMAALSPKEREVFGLLALGLTNGEIADRLFVAEATVKTHVGAVLKKLGLRDRVQVVIYAYQSGLAAPGEANI